MPVRRRIVLWVVLSFLLGLSFAVIAASQMTIYAQPGSKILVNGEAVLVDSYKVRTRLELPDSLLFPFTVTVEGPLGGRVEKIISSPKEADDLKITTGVISDKDPNPRTLGFLPKLCPRLIRGEGSGIPVYDGASDRMNRIPIMQFLDPDAGLPFQANTFVEMDGRNALLLSHVRMTYDYEDDAIIDYEGPNPLTGKKEVVPEGAGGFYANFHYAVVPYSPKILKMDRQTLLHLAQGKLKEIDKENLRPELRTHSLIPGPFLSKTGTVYEMCEWGDTAYQAPVQEMQYREMALWDWDYSVSSAGHVLLIVWEGDEEDWLIQNQLIDPFYLTDDLVGIFEIRREKTLKPLTLRNKKGDFEITVQTGDLGS